MSNSELKKLLDSGNAHALIASMFKVPQAGKTVTVPTEQGLLKVRISAAPQSTQIPTDSPADRRKTGS